jgi:hypothetical protein
MSIFQIRELWGTRVGSNEEFDKNSVVIDRSQGDVKVVVGKSDFITEDFR